MEAVVPGQYDILRSMLSDRIIAFHPRLSFALGGVNEALLFQQLAYWSGKGSDPDWIYKTRAEIYEETTLTRTQQEGARRNLRRLGVVEEERRGLPARIYFKIHWEVMFELLSSQLAENLPTSRQVPDQSDGGKPANLIDDKPPTSKSTQRVTNKENTEEFEISKDRQPEMNSFETRQALQPYIQDFAREFADQAKQPSTLTRAVDLCVRSGLDVDTFIDVMQVVRAKTKENSASIKSTVPGDR
ncbi:MAG: hypothetical protein ACR2OE_09890 [Thermomicrobiales bacterium]